MSERRLYSLEIERAVLGCILRYPNAVVEIDGALSAEHFYAERHRLVLAAIQDCWRDEVTPDLLTVSERLRSNGKLAEAGGAGYVSELDDVGTVLPQLRWSVGELRSLSLARRILGVAEDIAHRLRETVESPREILGRLQIATADLAQSSARSEWVRVSDVLDEVLARLRLAHNKCSPVLGLSTGLRDLDQLTGGMGPGQAIVIAGRPGMGKSALGASIALTTARAGSPVAVFSLEMSRDEVTERLLAQEGRVNLHGLRTGTLSESAFKVLESAIADRVRAAPIYIARDDANLGPAELVSAAHVAALRLGAKLVILDYLQLLPTHDAESREQAVAEASRTMKHIARKLEIPVLVLAQLNRESEKRRPPIPTLADLRESGQIEADADQVWLLYRPEHYEGRNCERRGEADVIVGKHRQGPTGLVTVRYDAASTRFDDLEKAGVYPAPDAKMP